MKNHDQFYSYARVYDVAFDFKNIKSECEFLRSTYYAINGRNPSSFLDLAAGPALHAIEMAKAGISSAALDLSPDMVDYGIEKARVAGVEVDYRQGDMVRFAHDRTFDMAAIFMDSASYLLSNEAVKSHLRSVSGALEARGLYVLEMSHPRDVFSVGKSALTTWEVEKDGVWASVEWGSPNDLFDPISQITETTVTMKFKIGEKSGELTETAPQRCFTANEFQALVEAEGSFEIVAIYGALKEGVPFNNEKSAWRMVPVLRKRF